MEENGEMNEQERSVYSTLSNGSSQSVITKAVTAGTSRLKKAAALCHPPAERTDEALWTKLSLTHSRNFNSEIVSLGEL